MGEGGWGAIVFVDFGATIIVNWDKLHPGWRGGAVVVVSSGWGFRYGLP